MAGTQPAGWPRDKGVWQNLRQAASPAGPLSVISPVVGFDIDRFVRANLDGLWNQADYALLDSAYADNFTFVGPTDRKFSGAADYRSLLESMRTAFPDLSLQVDEVYWMGNDVDGYLTSERWSATAVHAGDGLYGPASGREVQIWGITQHRVHNGRITAEWMLFNELDLMMQIAAAR